MFFNHSAALTSPKRQYAHFESYFNSLANKNREEHCEQYLMWIYGWQDGIKIISIDTQILSQPEGYYCKKLCRRYKYKFLTTIVYAKISDPKTGRI